MVRSGGPVVSSQGRGGGVFAISLTLPVTKENRNGSHWTLPRTSLNHYFLFHAERNLMSNPSEDLKETESALRSVIEVLIDCQERFQEIGDHLTDETLKHYFLAESLKRARFRGDLENVLHQEGVHDVKESGTTGGALRRAWADFKSRLGGGDYALLETAEEGDDAAIKIYSDATKEYLPLPVRQILATQSAHIQSVHDYVKAARDMRRYPL